MLLKTIGLLLLNGVQAFEYKDCYSCAATQVENYMCSAANPDDPWQLACCSSADADNSLCKSSQY